MKPKYRMISVANTLNSSNQTIFVLKSKIHSVSVLGRRQVLDAEIIYF